MNKKDCLENPGIDPGTSHMLSERSTIWASPPAHNPPMRNAKWGLHGPEYCRLLATIFFTDREHTSSQSPRGSLRFYQSIGLSVCGYESICPRTISDHHEGRRMEVQYCFTIKDLGLDGAWNDFLQTIQQKRLSFHLFSLTHLKGICRQAFEEQY